MRRIPAIGFQVTRIATEYANAYLPHLLTECRKKGAELVVFAGGSLLAPFPFDYQLNTIYNFMVTKNLDALVALTATLQNYVDPATFDAFIERLRPLPLVTVVVPIQGFPNIATNNSAGISELVEHLLLVHGRKKFIFIKGPLSNPESQERFAAFQQTLESFGIQVEPNRVRLGDFHRRTAKNEIRKMLLEEKLDFDAIVAANDDMAIGAIEELQDLGVDVPDSVSVVGFDDLPIAELCNPSLTTVNQPFAEHARAAVSLAFDQIQKRPFKSESTFSARMVVRTSCGCEPAFFKKEATSSSELSMSSKAEDVLELCRTAIRPLAVPVTLNLEVFQKDFEIFVRKLQRECDENLDGNDFLKAAYRVALRNDQDVASINYWALVTSEMVGVFSRLNKEYSCLSGLEEKLKILFPEAKSIIQARNQYRLYDEAFRFQSLIEQLLMAADLNGLYRTLETMLPSLGVSNFFMVLHRPVEILDDRSITPIQAQRKLVFGIYRGTLVSQEPIPVEDTELLPREKLEMELPYLAAMSLFSRETLLGYVCFEPGPYSMNFYDNLVMELGSSIKRIQMVQSQRQTEQELRHVLEELRASNQKLSELSQTDELTGLYNRRGFLDLSKHSLTIARRMKKSAMLIFIDLDGLKRINDSFGHSEGDSAIKAAAQVLRTTFRQVDLISRLGGDEFVVLTIDAPLPTSSILKQRLMKNIENFNIQSKAEWILSMSVGIKPISWDETKEITELMLEADALLYQEKIEKRKNNLTRTD